LGLIATQRLFAQIIPIFFIGSSPAAPTYLDEFASTTSTFIRRKISEPLENRG